MERTGAVPQSNSSVTTKSGFDFNFVSPTTFVELPSEGKYYPVDHPLHGQSTVEIREMTAHEEDILADSALQKSGVAINKMIANIVVDKRINVDSLLVGDKNAITVAARISGYGPDYKTSVSCPACGAVNKHEFDLSDLESKQSTITTAITHVGGRVFQMTLPRTFYNVRIKLLNSHEIADFTKPRGRAKKSRHEAKLQTNFLKLILHSIENPSDSIWYEDTPVIDQFVDSIPAIDASFLRSMYKILSPDVDMTQYFECDSCGHTQEMEVPLNAEFFWPDL